MATGAMCFFVGQAVLSRQPLRTLSLLVATGMAASVVVLLLRAALAKGFLRSR